ncbi:MAG: hypothetical protein ACKVS6_02080 [Planctomycetota bacterium]
MNRFTQSLVFLFVILTFAACNTGRGSQTGEPQNAGLGADLTNDINSGGVAVDASATQDNNNPKPRGANDPMLSSRRASESVGEESIPQILNRTRNELKVEKEKAVKFEENYTKTQKQLEDIQKEMKSLQNELETTRSERDRMQSKIRDLQERLVTAALRVAESEKESIETKILLERSLKIAADNGLVIDPAVDPPPAPAAKVVANAESRPANEQKPADRAADHK